MECSTQIYDPEDYHPAQNRKLPSGMNSIIEYEDLQSLLDNSHIVPDLVAGEIQPLKDNQNVDELFCDVNFELLSQLMSQPDAKPDNVDQKGNQSSSPERCFHALVSDDHVLINACKR